MNGDDLIPNLGWTSHQAFWSIDPVDGSDKNLGWGDTANQADSRPLKTVAEWVRRFQGATIGPTKPQIRILNDIDEDIWIGGINSPQGGQDAGSLDSFLSFIGVPTVLHSGTLTAVQAQSGNDRGYLEDTSIPVSWTASDLVSDTSKPRMICSTSTNRKAWLLKDLGSKRVQIDTPISVAFTVAAQIGSARSEFQVGEPYQVISIPKIAGLRVAPGLKFRTYNLHVHNANGTPQIVSAPQGGPMCVMSWLEGVTIVGNGSGIWKSVVAGSSSLSGGSTYFVASTLFAGTYNANNVFWVYHSSFASSGDNVIFGTRMRADHSAIWDNGENATSNWALWDCMIRAIIVNVSNVKLDTLVGAGNADYVIYSDWPQGVSLVCGTAFGANWTATGAAAKPIAIGALTYDYADLPANNFAEGWAIRGAP